MMLLRLRSPIFDHGVLGIPVRKVLRRGSEAKGEQELAEFREMASALLEAENPFAKDVWRAATKQYLGWLPIEADLHLELFDTLWQVEVVQGISDIKEDEQTARRLRLALFVVIQLYELHRPRRTSSMDVFNTHAVNATQTHEKPSKLDLADEEIESDPRQMILESRRQEWTHRLAFVKRRIGDILALLTRLTGITTANPAVPRKVLDSLGFLIAGTDKKGERASRLSDALEEIIEQPLDKVTSYILERLVADETRNPQWSSFDLTKHWPASTSLDAKGLPTMVRNTTQNELVVIPPPSGQ